MTKEQKYIPRIASELFGTAIIKADEALLMVQSNMEVNGGDMEQAYDDMKLIDDLLHVKQLHISLYGFGSARTANGNIRKNSTLHHSLMAAIESRCKE